MKKLHLFILMFLVLAACKENSVDSTVTQPAPVVLTKDADSVTATKAILVGEITGNAYATFEYGTTTGYGNTINAVPNYVTGNATVKANLVGLTPGTTYHFRARANNTAFVNGNDMTFVTAPVVLTKNADSVTATKAILVGEITGNAYATFEYGTSTSYGNNINAIPNYVNGKATVKATLVGLTPGTTYHFRARANFVNGNDMTFVTGTQLQIGDSYKKGVVIEVHITNGVQHGLIAAPVDQTTTGFGQNPPGYGSATFTQAEQLCANYGDGYRLPDSTEAKLMKKAKDNGILTNFVDPNYDPSGPYYTSTEVTGNTDWVYVMEIYGYNGLKHIAYKNNYLNARAVCSF